MKYFVFLCLISYCVARKLPNYIEACKPKETDISECIKQRVEELREKLNDGIPEMRIPSINPLEIPFAQMDLGEKSKASMKDIKLYGLPAFIIKDLKIDLDKDYIEIKVDIPHILAEGEYTVKGKLLILTLDGSGPGQINITNLEVSLIGHGERQIRHGKTFFKIKATDVTTKIGKVNLNFHNLFKDNPELTENANKILNENQEVLVESFAPVVVEVVKGFILGATGGVFDRYELPELFPGIKIE
uniref:Protein takeout-like n=1 Tax=Diabrotica virgifera virgifera TaxID=50390 RepID=A0A6P7H7H9_DIAVI